MKKILLITIALVIAVVADAQKMTYIGNKAIATCEVIRIAEPGGDGYYHQVPDFNEADPKGSVSCILYGDDELSEGSARVPLRFIHPSELRSFGSRSRGRGRPRSVRAFRQLSSDLH